MAKKKNPKKVVEKHFKLGVTRYNIYPNTYGGEDKAYEVCVLAATGKPVYWNKKNKCWYYYIE